MLAFTLRRRQLEHPLLLPATLTMSSYAVSSVAGFIQPKAGLNADWQSFCVVNGSITGRALVEVSSVNVQLVPGRRS